MNIQASSDLLSGVFFTMLGGISVAMSAGYPMGTMARMGPGFFPMMVGVILLLLGGCLILSSIFTKGESVGAIGLRQIFCVMLGIVAFGLLIEKGLVVAAIAAVAISSFARPVESYVEVILLAGGLSFFAAVVFVFGLNLPMRLLPF